MRIILVIPFRTLLNVNTELALAHGEEFYSVLSAAAEELTKKTGASFSSEKVAPTTLSYTKYTNLDEDHETWFSRPLFSCNLNSSQVTAAEEAAEKAIEENSRQFQSIKSIITHIYDNTFSICVAEIDVSIDDAAVQFRQPSDFERYLTRLSGQLAATMQKSYVEPALRQLITASRNKKLWPVGEALVRTPKQFKAFDDLAAAHRYPRWDEKEPMMLWSHRIFDIVNLSEGEVEALQPLLRVKEFEADKNYLMRWGTSYILANQKVKKFVDMNITNQYFYCLFDALSDSQKRLLRNLSQAQKKIHLNKVYSRYDRQETLIADVENELLDYMSGLQDINETIFSDIRESFGTDALVRTVQKRSVLLRERLARITESHQSVQRKLLSYILILVGGLQIIQLINGFFDYARGAEPDRFWGVVDLAQKLSFDLTMNVAMLTLVVGAAIYVVLTRKR